jgi:hypothetical protein
MSNLTNTTFNEKYLPMVADALTQDASFLSLFDNKSDWINGRSVNIPQYEGGITLMRDYQESNGTDYDFLPNGDTRTDFGNLRFDILSYQVKSKLTSTIDELFSNFDMHGATVKNTVAQTVDIYGRIILQQAGADTQTSNVIETTGGLTSIGPDGSSKSALTYTDIVRLRSKMNKDNLVGDRFLIVPTDMYTDLLLDEQIIKFNEFTGKDPVKENGVVMKLAGINIIEAPNVLNMTGNTSGADALDPFFNETPAAYHGALAFVKNAVAYAEGPMEFLTSVKSPDDFGNKFSLELVGAAKAGRSDGKGVYIIAQGG